MRGDMRRGTIVKNLWASRETYFVYLGPTKSMKGEAPLCQGYAISMVDGEWEIRKAKFYTGKCGLGDAEHFPVVGRLNIDRYLIDGILQAISMHIDDEREGGQT